MEKVETSCPPCYHKLPDPNEVLGPCDAEFNYFMWIPGFEWKPEPEQFDDYETDSEGEEHGHDAKDGVRDEDLQEALEDMVEEKEMKHRFNDKAKGGRIQAEHATVLARQLGLAPSYMDVDNFKEENGDEMDYTTFQKFCAQSTHPDDNVENFVAVFAAFDSTNSGFLSKKQVKNILVTFGENLSEEEATLSMEEFCKSDPVDYRQFCEALVSI